MESTTISAMHNITDISVVRNTTMASCAATAAHASPVFRIVVKVVYAIGIIGNAAAIVALRRGERRMRNRKHLLLLTSLAANDLVALVGMMCSMIVGELVPSVTNERGFCVVRVVLRVFGIGSVCIAVTMALERYMALTRPFLYQKQVTYYVIRTALLASWGWAALLTCLPALGVGLYYDAACGACSRYRLALTPADLAYAIFYVIFGTMLCLILVYCNLAVIRALYAITAPGGGGAPAVRRVSRTSCRQRQRGIHSGDHPPAHHNAATAEEVAFSRLMATLSVLFMICWLPQMLTSALYLAAGRAADGAARAQAWARLAPLAGLSDVLMLLNYVLNPLLYVLLRRRARASAPGLCHAIAHCFKRSHKSSSESVSMKTSCCPQETLMVSDSSGAGAGAAAELRPLRPALLHQPSAHTLKLGG